MLLLHVWVPTRSQQWDLIVPLKPSRGERQEVRVGWFNPEMDGLGPFVLLLKGNWLESGWEQVDNPLPPNTSRLTKEVCRYLNMARRLQDGQSATGGWVLRKWNGGADRKEPSMSGLYSLMLRVLTEAEPTLYTCGDL